MMTDLEARVIACNRANEVANQIYEEVVEIFRSRIGEQVCKVDGSFMKKIKNLLPKWKFPDKYPKPTVMVYRNRSDYTVSFVAKTCQQVEDTHHCVYMECVVYICDLKEGKFVADKIYDPPNNRTDYDAEEVIRLRKDYEEKKRAADAARSALYPFGEHDH